MDDPSGYEASSRSFRFCHYVYIGKWFFYNVEFKEMKKLIMSALLVAATTVNADPGLIIQNGYQNPFMTGFNNAQAIRNMQDNYRANDQEAYNRRMMQIEMQRNQIMQQQNNIMQYPQLYIFGYRN